ncbi:MAG: hypothetical protein AAF823_13055 [Planctomycetota bacterium]
MKKTPALLSCALALTTTGLIGSAEALPPEREVVLDARAKVASNIDDVRDVDRARTDINLSGGDTVDVAFVGEDQALTLDLDAKQRSTSPRFKLKGEASIETLDDAGSATATTDFDRVRGTLRVKQNRNGAHRGRIKVVGGQSDGDDRFVFRARGVDRAD